MDMHETYGRSENYEVIELNYFRFLYFQKNYREIISRLPKSSKILEIGPGGGTFTEYLMQSGFSNITLCEYSSLIATELSRYFKDKSNIKVINSNALSYLQNCEVKYDVIISQHVIEHFKFDDFVILLERIYDNLNKNGVVILETNNCANIIYGMYLRYCDHTHLLGFTPRSLENFLESQNLVVQDVFPIYMTGVKDLLYALWYSLFSRKEYAGKAFNRQITSTPPVSKIWLGITFVLRSIAINISRLVSFLFVYPYEKSLGAIKRSVFTPTFAVVAKKDARTETCITSSLPPAIKE